MPTLLPLWRAARTTGKQCGLTATGDYQPSLRSPWLAAGEFISPDKRKPPTPHTGRGFSTGYYREELISSCGDTQRVLRMTQ
ncbi:MAG: hypothetical protein RNU03_12550 [Candidatus Sedimenticola sp. (ex Thyasira tokunagai)]